MAFKVIFKYTINGDLIIKDKCLDNKLNLTSPGYEDNFLYFEISSNSKSVNNFKNFIVSASLTFRKY